MAKAKDKYENFKAPIRRETGKSKPKEMSRTSGVARRAATPFGEKGALLTGSQITSAIRQGVPLTGSASGVKNITLKDAGEVLTQGIVTLGKKGLQMDPAALAMALPIGKVAKAASALRAAGKVGRAAQLEARIASKVSGAALAKSKAFIKKFGNEFSFPATPPSPRIGSKAYPKSFGQFGRPSPVSDLATNKTPSAGTFRIGPKVSGYKVVDNRYRYDELLNPKNYRERAAKVREAAAGKAPKPAAATTIKRGSLTQKANPLRKKREYVPGRVGRDVLAEVTRIKRGSLTTGQRELLPSKVAQTYEQLELKRLMSPRTNNITGSAFKDFYKNAFKRKGYGK